MLPWIRVIAGRRPPALVRSTALHLGCGLALLATQVAAEPVGAPPPSTAHSLRLTLKPMGTQLPWTYRIENVGDHAVAIADDASLLWLKVSDPKTKRSTRCELPPTFQAVVDSQQPLALAPGSHLDRNFDARLYCFSSTDQKHLIANATVEAFYGRSRSRRRRTNAVTPNDSAAPGERVPRFPNPVMAESQITSAPVVLDEQYNHWAEQTVRATDDIAFEVVAGSDARSAREAQVTVRVLNRSQSVQSLIFRQESIEYTLSGPSGTFQCPATVGERTSTKVTLFQLQPHRSTSLTTLLAEVCPREALALPGLYQVQATLLPNGATDESTEDRDLVPANSVALLRLHEGAPPFPRQALGRVLPPLEENSPRETSPPSNEPIRATSFQLPPEPDPTHEQEPELDVDRVE